MINSTTKKIRCNIFILHTFPHVSMQAIHRMYTLAYVFISENSRASIVIHCCLQQSYSIIPLCDINRCHLRFPAQLATGSTAYLIVFSTTRQGNGWLFDDIPINNSRACRLSFDPSLRYLQDNSDTADIVAKPNSV